MANPNEDIAVIKGMDRLGFKLMGGFARIFGALAAKDEESYWYTITAAAGAGFIDLPAVIGLNAGVATIRITQEADFVCTRVLQENLNPVTGVPIVGSWTATLQDGSTDRRLMDNPVHGNAFAGNAFRSTPWTKNRLFRRNSTITLTFDQRQAVATRVFIAFQGYKIFDEASLDLVRRR